MEEQEQKFSLSGSFKKLRQYIDSQVELIKLRAIARSSRIFGSLIVDMTKILLVLMIFFFWSMALAFYLGNLLGNNALGFLAAGGIFFLLIIIINLLKKRLELRLMDIVIRKFLGKWDEVDNDLEEDRLSRLKRKAEEAEREAEKIKEEIEHLEDEHEQGT